MDAALEYFALDVTNKEVLDAGASTGGFTDCLLQRGAAKVVAVDVGQGQLLARLRSDRRVEVLERVNVRNLRPEALGGRRFGLVVADLSFISLRSVANALLRLTEPGGAVVVLVKPQFEVGRQVVSKGRGVVRSPEAWSGALVGVAEAFVNEGAQVLGAMPSPIRGAEGNAEFLLYLRSPDIGGPGQSLPGALYGELRRVAEDGDRWHR